MNGFIPRARYNPENTHSLCIVMPFKLGKVEKRLLTCGGLLVAGTCSAPVLGYVGISAAAIPLISSIITGVTGGLVANDIGNITDSLGKNQGILINHDLTKAVGRAIGAIILAMAREPQYQKQKKALEKLAQAAADNWEIAITSEAKEAEKRITGEAEEPGNRYGDLTEDQLSQIILNPQTPILETKEWEYLLWDWLEELAQVKLEDATRKQVATRLREGFSIALRETLADDFETGGKAFANLTISLFRELHNKMVQQHSEILQQLQQVGKSQSELNQALTRLEHLGQLQPGTLETQREFQALGKGIATVLVEVREIKENTLAIQKEIGELRNCIEKQTKETRVVVEVQYPPLPSEWRNPPVDPNSGHSPASREPSEQPKTVGLETIAEIPVWVGRDALLQNLKTKLLAPETPPKVLTIIGQGGIGKTSLAAKLLETLGVQLQPPTLAETCPYQKARYFKTYEGTSFDEVAEFFLRGLDIETREPLKTAAEKITKILDGLTKQRSVVVLDNLEDILHPAHHPDCGKALSLEWGQLLHALVYSYHRSTLILTSREFPVDLTDSRARTPIPDSKLVEVLTLSGVEDADGVEILRQRGSEDSEEDCRWIAERVKGNVFILTQLAAFGAESPGYLRKHPELVTEEAEKILQAQLGRQSQAGLDLLQRMCVLRVGIDIQGLTFLRLYTDDREKDKGFERKELKKTEEIIMRLVNSSLVQRRYDKEQCEWYYDLHRLIVEYLQAQYQAELPKLMEQAYKFYCTGKTVDNPTKIEDIRYLLEIEYFALKLGYYDLSAFLLLGQLGKYLSLWGNWNLLIDLHEEILSYSNIPKNVKLVLAMQAGQLYYNRGNLKIAKEYYILTLSMCEKNIDNLIVLNLIVQLATIEYFIGNKNKSKKLLQFILSNFEHNLGCEYFHLSNALLEIINHSGGPKLWHQELESQGYQKILTQLYHNLYKRFTNTQ